MKRIKREKKRNLLNIEIYWENKIPEIIIILPVNLIYLINFFI